MTMLGKTWFLARRLATSHAVRAAAWNNLLKEISYTHQRPRAWGHPQVMEIETTNRCPFTCVMCPRTHAMTRPVGDMDIGLFRELIDQMRPEWQMDKPGGKPVVRLLHYGEPFVYRYFAEAIDYCRKRKYHVFISSNPAAWTERRMAEVLDTGLDELMVMIDGLDDETSMAIRGPAASFTRAEANLRKLAAMKTRRGTTKPFIVVAMIRQPRNRHQWERFESYWKGIEGIDATYLGHYSTFDNNVQEINALNETLIQMDKSQAEQAARQQYLSRYPCYYPWHSVCITWQGEVVPCCRDYNSMMVLGNLNHQSLEDIWNGPALQELRRNFILGRREHVLCRRCTEASLEIGLPGRHYVPARWLRRWGIGRMHQATGSSSAIMTNLAGAQNISGGGYKPATAKKDSSPEKDIVQV